MSDSTARKLSLVTGSGTPIHSDLGGQSTIDPAETQPSLLPTGALLGRFRVLRPLGAGGMGEVYLCEDPTLDRLVAVKRVREQASARAQERLRHEARALARFAHDNIVGIHEIGEIGE
ncbi:MAG: protein kinase, partial [Myxococcales bacterium]|nr:protein kinase [Myxococcales bacterium]